MDGEKRAKDAQSRRLMMTELTDAQQAAIVQLEGFGWYLSFVRRPLFKPVIPVLHDEDTDRYAILEPDGSLNEDCDLTVRH